MGDTGILGKILYLFNKQKKCPTPPKNDDAGRYDRYKRNAIGKPHH